MTRDGYDIVIVGGGSAGCVLASRLSEQPETNVLLIEAGPAKGPGAMSVVPAWPSLLGSSVDWRYATTPQPGLTGEPIPYPQGKVLGGSSAINAMAFLRGQRADYDRWAELGAVGWGYEDLLPYFRRSEHAPERDPRYRGRGGPMRVEPAAVTHPIAQAGLDAVQELGFSLSPDLSGQQQTGGGPMEMNAVNGVRLSAYDAYLAPVAGRPNLQIITDALVRKLTIRHGRCKGVEYLQNGQARRVSAAQVVVAAGAIGSPRLLLHSGIGPADELRALGTEVVVDSSEVGRNLQDHPLAGVVYAAKPGFPDGVNNHADAMAVLSTRADLERPDIQLLFMDIPFHPPTVAGPAAGYTIAFTCLQPHSRGSVRLTSADPLAPPQIDPGFYRDERDLATMVDALDLARRIGRSDALAKWRETEALPGPQAAGREATAAFLRRTTGTYFHPVGTCRLGSDPGAVVDTQLRVKGVEGLRVADASVFPTIVSANTNATVLAIAERAADLMTSA
jgi:choline dehydrogenase